MWESACYEGVVDPTNVLINEDTACDRSREVCCWWAWGRCSPFFLVAGRARWLLPGKRSRTRRARSHQNIRHSTYAPVGQGRGGSERPYEGGPELAAVSHRRRTINAGGCTSSPRIVDHRSGAGTRKFPWTVSGAGPPSARGPAHLLPRIRRADR